MRTHRSPLCSAAWYSMTVVELRAELRERGLKVSGKKAELIERLGGRSVAAPSVLSDASLAAAKSVGSAVTAVKWVGVHTGERDASGHLKQFKAAPAHFRPNLTPRQMLLKGMHGGIYFNPKGGKPGIRYPRSTYPKGIPGVSIDEFPPEWFTGVPVELFLSRRYSAAHNCYRVKSGLDQAGWESSGWINDVDPRGWTQWYFRFYMGRRLPDGEDERQIGRWSGVAGVKGRWKQNLIAKCLRDESTYDDVSVSPVVLTYLLTYLLAYLLTYLLTQVSVSPVVRQTLVHWAYELCEADFHVGAKRVKTHGASYLPREQLTDVFKKTRDDTPSLSSASSFAAAAASATAAAAAASSAADRAQRAQRRAQSEEPGGIHR